MDLPGVGRSRSRTRRRWDSARRRRRRALAGLLLLGLGGLVLCAALAAGRVPPPPDVRLDPAGTTAVPRTWFFQERWVLFAQVDDPRRPPSPRRIGCDPGGGLSRPPQPADMTVYGSRVLDGESVAAVQLLSRSGGGSAVRCRDAEAYGPLWLLPESEAPPFGPSAIALGGVLLLVAGALTHPATTDLPHRWRRGEPGSGDGA